MMTSFDDRDRASIERDLRDADEEVRRLAIERVGTLPAGVAIPHLIKSLGDASWRVRKAAIERIVARAEGDEVADALVGALADGENPGRRNAAVEALVHCGPRVLPRLIVEADSRDEDVRKLVVDAFAGIGDAGACDKLLELLGDADPNVRASSADALGAIGGEVVPAALLGTATDEREDQLVRYSAIRALATLEVPVRPSELGEIFDDPLLGPAALSLLGRGDDSERDVEVLLKALGSSSRSSREATMRALLNVVGRSGAHEVESIVERIRGAVAASPHVVAQTIERLADADLSTQLVLVQFLGIVGGRDAVLPVLVAGRDEAVSQVALAALESLGSICEEVLDAEWHGLDLDSRREGCVLFGRLPGGRSAARLLSALDDVSGEVRTAAARSIGWRRLDAGIRALVQRLVASAADDDFESEEELIAVTEALTALSQPAGASAAAARTIQLLTASLDGSGEDVRLAIATVIGQIGRQQDSEIVAFLLRDPSSRVRRASVEALARIEPHAASEPLRLALADEAAVVRIAAANALGASGSDQVVRDLVRLADDEDPRVRSAAVHQVVVRFAVASDDDVRETALRVLDEALADEASVALSAIEALCEAGGPETSRAEAMLEHSEPELVRAAIRCIAIHADASGLESLLPLVAHPDWSVRAEAIGTVADRGLLRAVPAILRRLETEQDEFVRDLTLRALKKLESGIG